MALYFDTNDPTGLLSEFRLAIEDGKIQTWSIDHDGDFTHTARQWIALAWLRPVIRPQLLYLHFIKPRGQRISKAVYGIYHGRFIESMLIHFDHKFLEARATAMPSADDTV